MKRIFTRLTLIALVSAFFVPMLNTVAVWPFYIDVSSDIAYADWVGELLHVLYGVLDILVVYAMAFCLAYAFRKSGERVKITLIVILSLIAVCVAAVRVDVHYNGAEILTSKFIGYNVLRVVLDAARLAVAAIVTVLFVKRHKGCESRMICRISTGVILLSEFIVNGIETVSIFSETAKEYENWTPQNSSEWLTILTPYINMTIYFILGYFLCRGLLSLLELKKRGN
ncbi:MAG: hypothetical protein IJY93_10245 [Clostridia bacterium]|nr:hypothetical protein [Clostridia bacterium]